MTPSLARLFTKADRLAHAAAFTVFGLAVATLVLLGSAAGRGAASAAASVYATPPSINTVVSSTFSLDLMADCASNADAVSLIVSFDPRLLQAKTVSGGTAFPNALRSVIDNAAGKVYYDAGAPLTCHDDGNCPAGVVRVAELGFLAVGAAAAPTAVTVSGKLTWSGAYLFNGTGMGSAVTIRLRGDVDVDCDVDLADMMLVAQSWDSSSGGPGFSPAYDLDLNGAIDILDVMSVAVHWGDVCVVP